MSTFCLWRISVAQEEEKNPDTEEPTEEGKSDEFFWNGASYSTFL